ncbi:MAG TPA: copper homeostasis protein CutC [Candidatus Baltobacteraceae bacterium]|nr:copper homeostasis protein CutC [Candidatus Baltobacteraceae bacterium]
MESSPPVLEVIVTGAEEARTAEAGGADRLELVAEPERGGLSPSIDVVEQVRRAVRIPVNVMVRDRDGGFCYDGADVLTMIDAAKRFMEAGADGLVFGALTGEGELDAQALTEFLAHTGCKSLTFHRAFDEAANPKVLYEQLAVFPGVARVLTAGAAANVLAGIELLKELIARDVRPIVLVGGGVTQANLRSILAATAAREIHVGTASRTGGRVDEAKVRRLAEILKS